MPAAAGLPQQDTNRPAEGQARDQEQLRKEQSMASEHPPQAGEPPRHQEEDEAAEEVDEGPFEEGPVAGPEHPEADFSDYQILLLQTDHPYGFLFDTARDSATGRVYVAGYRRDPEGNPGQLELSGCPVGAELLSVNQIAITGSRARYMHCVSLFKGKAVTLQVRIFGEQPALDEEDQQHEPQEVAAAPAVVPDGRGPDAVRDEGPPPAQAGQPAQEPAQEPAQQQQQQQQPQAEPRHSLPSAARPSTPPARVDQAPAAGAADPNAGVTANLMAAMATMLESLGNAPRRGSDPEEAEEDGGSFLPFISKVLASPGFAHFVSRRCVPQYYQSFLPSCVGEYMAKFLPPDQVHGLVSYIKSQVDDAFFRTFRGSRNYALHAAATVRDARTFSLQAALHKSYPLLASEGCRSITQQPVFYLTEGSAIHETARRYLWDLYLTPDSLHVVPLRPSASDGAGFPAYCMDAEALERQIVADRKAGRLPCVVLATFGAEANRPYQSDNLAALRRVCDRHGVWLHVEGSSTLLSAAPRASPILYSAFEYANSVVMQPMDWFGGKGSLSFALVRSSKTHTHHQRHLLPPEAPMSVQEFTDLFTLWYHLVGMHRHAEAVAAEEAAAARRPASAHDTFFGTPVRAGAGLGDDPAAEAGAGARRSGRDSAPLAGRVRGDTLLSNYVAHNLDLCRHFKSALGAMGASVGPGYEHPHIVLFQLLPPGDMPLSLEEMNLTANGFNKMIFSRLHYLYTLQHRGLPVPAYAARLGLGGTVEADLSDREFEQRASFLPASVRRELAEMRPRSAGGARQAAGSSSSGNILYRTPSSSAAAPLPASQVIYDNRVGFLFHPLAQRTGLGSCSALNQLGGVDGELGGAGPQDSPLRSKLGKDSVDTFLALVRNEMGFIARAAAGRGAFARQLDGLRELQYVPHEQVPGTFVGVGAFRFVPAFPVSVEHANALNAHLANLLAERDPIYRGVVAADRLVCVAIQSSDRLSDDFEGDVARLVDQVLEVADKMELPAEVAESLSNVVLKGIRDAEARLQAAADEEYSGGAFVRRIPLVGSLFNWIAPGANSAEDGGLTDQRSQAFDLRGGHLGRPRFVEAQNSEKRLVEPSEDALSEVSE